VCAQSVRGQMVPMSPKHDMRRTPKPPATPATGRLIDWLAFLMLLAGSVVWPR
jgi:hypothetical protein